MDDQSLPYFEPGSSLVVGGREMEVEGLRMAKRGHVVRFSGVTDRAGAELLRGLEVASRNRRPLGEGEYWPEDLVGLQVRPGGGTVLGVSHGPAQDRLIVERSGRRFEVPFVDELVPVVDLEGGFVEVVEVPGLTEQ